MKLRYAVASTLFVIALILYPAAVHADSWSALSSGYAVTTDHHGVIVWPLPKDVTAKAGTTEYPPGRVPQFPDVTKVRFRWMPPAESGLSEWFSPPLSDPPMDLWDSLEDYEDQDGNFWDIYIAEDTQTINAIGDWGVQAWFYDTEGNLRNQTGIEKIRATSFNAIPEIPLGTIGAAATMIIALALFALKKKETLRIPHKF